MRLNFLGYGHQDLTPRVGPNSAFIKATNQGNNMLLMDCGGKTMDTIDRLGLLDGTDRLIAFYSHIHDDHIDKAADLHAECKRRKIEISYLLPMAKEQRDQIRNDLVRRGVIRNEITEIMPYNAAAMMRLHGIETKALDHQPNCKTTALIMRNHPFGRQVRTKTIFAPDHFDEKFIREVVANEIELDDLYTDCTDFEGSTSHFPFGKLCETVPQKLRKYVTLMGMTSPSLVYAGRDAGFNTADDFLYRGIPNEERTKDYRNMRGCPGKEKYRRPAVQQRGNH